MVSNTEVFSNELDRATDVHFHIHISLTREFLMNLLHSLSCLEVVPKRLIIEAETPERGG